jgi:HSP20 family protein
MLTLRHTSPFDLFDRLDQQLFTAERVPPAEVRESDDAYEVVLELPGVDRSAIDVKATDRTLAISAERRPARPLASEAEASADAPAWENGQRQRGPLLSEFRYGTWSRSFRFSTPIEREQLEATYRDGLLTVKAPKAQRMSTVTVKVGE